MVVVGDLGARPPDRPLRIVVEAEDVVEASSCVWVVPPSVGPPPPRDDDDDALLWLLLL